VRWVVRFAACFWLLLAACRDERRTLICDDGDGDGYGPGCARGADCDDADPLRASDCSDAGVTQEECEAAPVTQGCPCLRSEQAACFPGPLEREGVGRCKAGLASCDDGRFTACRDVVLPSLELCNREDDDCDGFVDEGVESPCGGCNSECLGGVWGTGAAPFEVEAPLALTAAGELSLVWQPWAADTLWIPNTDEGSVSKIDARSAKEVARLRTRGGYPIQVAVDRRGDAFVLDGVFGGSPWLTKISGDEVAFALPLSAADDPRTLAVDGALGPDSQRAGNVWIGYAGSQQLVSLAGDDGAELARFDIARHALQPSAAGFDLYGYLWLIDRAGKVLRFDALAPDAGEVLSVPYACYTLEALSLDSQGRLLLSGFGCERVFSYDPRRAQWRSAQVPGLLSPRGVLAGPAVLGSWVGFSSGQIARLTYETLQPGAASTLASDAFRPYETFALTVDGLGKLWAISTQGGPDGVGVATRFDPETKTVSAQVPLGRGPRAGGDLSGSAAGGEYTRDGRASHVFAGCGREARTGSVGEEQTEWLNLRVVALLGAGAKVRVWVRHAVAVEQLTAAPYMLLGELPRAEPFPLSLPAGGAIEVALDLESSYAIGAPRISRVGVEWSCPSPD
jgi:streptogramin lyase